MPAGWILVEWLRGWLFSGFPWLSLGYAHLDTPLRGYAPVLGVYGVGLAAAISAGAIVTLLLGTRVSRIVAALVDRGDMGRGRVADTRRVDRAA